MDEKMKSIVVWDVFVRFFHWTLVGSIICLYLSGEAFNSIHTRLGYFVVCLVLARIFWGFVGTKHARFIDFFYRPSTIFDYVKSLIKGDPKHYLGHNPAGGLMVFALLFILLATTFTGLKALAIEGKGPLAYTDPSTLGVAYADEDEHDDDSEYGSGHRQRHQKDKFWEDIHESMTHFLIFLIVIHVGGVIVSSWIHKENLIMAMITGQKKIE